MVVMKEEDIVNTGKYDALICYSSDTIQCGAFGTQIQIPNSCFFFVRSIVMKLAVNMNQYLIIL